MARWAGPSWPISTTPSPKLRACSSVNEPPAPSRSKISMARDVRNSYSPAAGIPRAGSSEAPRIRPAPTRPRAPAEIVLHHRVVQLEAASREPHPGGRLGVGDLLDPDPQVVDLQDLHMAAELRRDQEIGRASCR